MTHRLLSGPFNTLLSAFSILCVTGLMGWFHGTMALPSTAQMEKLRKGQVLVEEIKIPSTTNGSDQKGLQAIILIERPLQQVWSLITNQPALFQGDPQMKSVRVVKKGSTAREWVEYTLKISKFLPQFQYITQVDYQSKKSAHFKRTSGSFNDFEGTAVLTPIDNGSKTLLHYTVRLDLGMLIPQFVVNNVLKNDMPRMMSDIEKRVVQRYPADTRSNAVTTAD